MQRSGLSYPPTVDAVADAAGHGLAALQADAAAA
jgi:hypothetical protein